MKKLIKYALMLFLALSVFSCGENKKKSSYHWEKRNPRIDYNMQLSKADTTHVLEIAKEYLDLLKENRIEEAFSKLYEIDEKNSIKPLSAERRRQLEQTLTAFPVLSYKITEVLFFSETDTEVRYTSTFFEKSEDDGRPNTIQCVLNPKRISNTWYLTLSENTREY